MGGVTKDVRTAPLSSFAVLCWDDGGPVASSVLGVLTQGHLVVAHAKAQCHLVLEAFSATETIYLGYVSVMDALAIFGLYLELASAEVFRSLQRQLKLRLRNGIYSARVVLWMMINQRLQGRGTLARSVEQLVQGRFDALLSRCKRVETKRIAVSTGGYCQARQRLPKLLVSRSMDELIERLRSRLLESDSALPQRVYLLDGSSLQLEHEPELLQAFPPGSNQRGRSHWPLIRLVVLHDLETGLAEHPYWGPMNGPRAVSEQALAEHAMQHIPAGSVIVGDRNFGIFSIAYSAQRQAHGVILRLTAVRAKSLLGSPISRSGDYPVCWRASRWDGKGKRAWPADASVPGRLIAARVGRGKHQQWLYLFTTLSLPSEEVVALYGRRWSIETDLRGLKQTVRLQHLTAQSVDMMEKELLVAILAYNLVRALMALAAQRAKIHPRELSFTYACNIVLDGYPKILAARTPRRQQAELERIIELVAQCRLPKRKKRRSYPREVWGRGYRFPLRKEEKTK
jgi:putative transposase